MSIYVFWQIVFFSALIGVLSVWVINVLERKVSPQYRMERAAKKTRKEAATYAHRSEKQAA